MALRARHSAISRQAYTAVNNAGRPMWGMRRKMAGVNGKQTVSANSAMVSTSTAAVSMRHCSRRSAAVRLLHNQYR